MTGAREKIAAVGAGRMGRGLAITFAMAGHRVSLIDLKNRPAEDAARLRSDALAEIANTLDMLADLGLMANTAVPTIVERVTFAGADAADDALATADILLEGVPETLDAKRNAFDRVCRHARSEAIIASTTSTILADDLQALVSMPGRFLNAHWLNPAFLVPLVEVSPGTKTRPDIVRDFKNLLESIGKIPVICKASPGFIVPRIQALAMNEAARMVEEGVASADDIDKATKYGFGFRFAVLGLLEFIDWGGGDILYYASRYLESALGSERYRAPQIISDNMEEGRIGVRSRSGFLDYDGLDVAAYQRDRLGAFIALLKHLDAAPVSVVDNIPNPASAATQSEE